MSSRMKIASAEEYGSNRAALQLSSVCLVTGSVIIMLEIWSSVSGTSAIAVTPSSLSGSTTFLQMLKL
jgi:hypothetical protein